jgi:hypothetical protein
MRRVLAPKIPSRKVDASSSSSSSSSAATTKTFEGREHLAGPFPKVEQRPNIPAIKYPERPVRKHCEHELADWTRRLCAALARTPPFRAKLQNLYDFCRAALSMNVFDSVISDGIWRRLSEVPESVLLELELQINRSAWKLTCGARYFDRFLAHPVFVGRTLVLHLDKFGVSLSEFQMLAHLVGPDRKFQRLTLKYEGRRNHEQIPRPRPTSKLIAALVENPKTAPSFLDVHEAREVFWGSASCLMHAAARQPILRELIVDLDVLSMHSLAAVLLSPLCRLERLEIHDQALGSVPFAGRREPGLVWPFFEAMALNKTLADLELPGYPEYWYTQRDLSESLLTTENDGDVEQETWEEHVGARNFVLDRIRFGGFLGYPYKSDYRYPVLDLGGASSLPSWEWTMGSLNIEEVEHSACRRNGHVPAYNQPEYEDIIACGGFLLRNRRAKAIEQLFLMYCMCRRARTKILDPKPFARILFAMHGCPLPTVLRPEFGQEDNVECDLTTPTGVHRMVSRFEVMRVVRKKYQLKTPSTAPHTKCDLGSKKRKKPS